MKLEYTVNTFKRSGKGHEHEYKSSYHVKLEDGSRRGFMKFGKHDIKHLHEISIKLRDIYKCDSILLEHVTKLTREV